MSTPTATHPSSENPDSTEPGFVGFTYKVVKPPQAGSIHPEEKHGWIASENAPNNTACLC